MEQNLALLKQFEAVLKKILIQQYGKYLPESKVALLNKTNYVYDELLRGNKTVDEVQGIITRDILRSVINMETTKDIVLTNGNTVTIKYGDDIERGLVEYYAKELSDKFHFDINEFPDLRNDLEFVKALNDKLDDRIDEKAFSSDALSLLNEKNLREIVEKYDVKKLREFFERNAKLVEENKTNQEQNDFLMENTERNRLQLVWIDNKKNIKYIDMNGDVHLLNIDGRDDIEKLFNEKIANLGVDETLNPEELYHLIEEKLHEEGLDQAKNKDLENLNFEQMDMLTFVEANDNLRKTSKDEITHNDEMKIHVTENDNNIILTNTDNNEQKVSAYKIKDEEAEAKDKVYDTTPTNEIIPILEYENLWQRFYNGEELTKTELERLRQAYTYYSQKENKELQEEIKDQVEKEKGPILKPTYVNNNNNGFSNKMMVLYITIILVLAITVLLIYIFGK